VGKPGQGKPVRVMTGRECPSNSLNRNAILDMIVFGYIDVIVDINEIAIIDLPEDH
jgi:hypothetical protein